MSEKKRISGFSKLSKAGRIKWIVEHFFYEPEVVFQELRSYWHNNEDQQKILDGFSENTISNFHMPYSVAPNFIINGKTYCIPMVIEESSVVAAASSAAKYWMSRGGFHTEVISMTKIGQLYFKWKGDFNKLQSHFKQIKNKFIEDTRSITKNMESRGGGLKDMELMDWTTKEPHLYQIKCSFDTQDSMGANFINSILEQYGKSLVAYVQSHQDFFINDIEIQLAILSNYTPECLVKAWVSCPINDLVGSNGAIDPLILARKFQTAVNIAKIDPYRATTHNKGIFNGIDAVVLATGNDFRAVEACGHAYAGKDGQYRSLTDCTIENGIFKFSLEIPLAIGTVGGLTTLHPMAKRSLELLENPSAEELMGIIAATGLAQNFAALRSLVTTGIQKGHMKMHLINVLLSLDATQEEQEKAIRFFEDKSISHSQVGTYLESIRKEV